MSRTIFPNLKLFKKETTERFIVALREIFREHPAYKFDDDDLKSHIHIQPTYANVSYKGKKPYLLVKAGRYEFSLRDTFYGNLVGEVSNSSGKVSGHESFKLMSANITVITRAYAEEESSDIADELAVLALYAARGMFTQVGINVRGAQVSDTSKTDPQNDTYDTAVNFDIETSWSFTTTGDEGVDPGIDIEGPETEGNRSPGVNVYRQHKHF